ncbi:MAG: MraY family glycosyltransferase [Bacteroidota bacterium]
MLIDSILGTVISFSFTLFLTPIFKNILTKYSVLELRNKRKIHKKLVPSMGGVIFVFSFFCGLLFTFEISELSEVKYIILSLLMMLFIGLRDDIIPIPAKEKLISQILPILLIIFFNNYHLKSLNGFLGIYDLPYWLGVVLSTLVFLCIVNSYNLIDGIDGLACSISVITLSVFNILLITNSFKSLMSDAVIILIASIVAFLVYNWQPAKIFMGDTGALFLGFFNSILVLDFINTPNETISSPLAFILAILAIPIIDTLRTFISRIIRGVSPFTPDKTHIHHMLLRLGLSHSQTVFLLSIVNLMFILVAFLIKSFPDTISIVLITSLGLLSSLSLDLMVKRKILLRKSN